ncbi:hypothetical protein C9J85_03055 [Haloferax sp. wsp5]|nr:hypothetical protein C9J85_03055 [Haloferax sp. wsp5]
MRPARHLSDGGDDSDERDDSDDTGRAVRGRAIREAQRQPPTSCRRQESATTAWATCDEPRAGPRRGRGGWLRARQPPRLPDPQTVALCLLFSSGMAVPTRYGMERIEGFGRLVASKLPYKAPPGTDEETAMQATQDGDK